MIVTLFGSEKSTTSVASIVAGSDSKILKVSVVWQPSLVVTVTQYVPIWSISIDAVVSFVDHK